MTHTQHIRWAASVALSLGLLCLLPGCGSKPPPADQAASAADPQPTVQVAAAVRGDLQRLLPATGLLQPLPGRETTLTSPAAGVLESIAVRYGQEVQQGQVIARLSTRQILGQVQQAQAALGQAQVQVQQAEANALQQQAQTRAAIRQARAGVRNAEATLAGAKATLIGADAGVQNAQQTLARAQTLLADGLIPRKDVEAAQLALRTAVAQQGAQRQAVDGQRQTVAGQEQAVAAAQAAAIQDQVKRKDVQIARQQVRNAQGALTTARAQLALYTLHAPLSGQISLVGANAGETVDTTTKIATITNLDTLQLQIGIPGNAASAVRVGQPLTFRVASLPGQVFRATLNQLSAQVDAVSGTVPAFALVPNPGYRLKDGAVASAQIVTERRTGVLLVPSAAILTDPDTKKTSVVVVGADSVAHVVAITTGLAANGQTEVQSGLSDGQKVAVSGQYGLPDKTTVTVATNKAGETHGP